MSALAVSVGLTPCAATLRVGASTTWAENIGRSSAPSDWRDAAGAEINGSFGHFRQLTAGLVVTGDVVASYEAVPRYHQLDTFTAGVSGQVRQKFGFGAMAPVISLDAQFRGRETRRAGEDGWTANAGLRFGKRITEAWRASVVGDWQQHYARSDFFDTRQHRAYALIAWDITDRLQLSHGNGRLWGNFSANASPGVWSRALSGALGPEIFNYYNTVPWGVTETFGPGWVTYRVRGHMSFWWLELSPALGRDTSLPLRFESRFSVNKVGVKYRQNLWTIQWLRRF